MELLVHRSWAKCMDFVLSDNHLVYTSEEVNESVLYKIETKDPSVGYTVGFEMAVQMGLYKETRDEKDNCHLSGDPELPGRNDSDASYLYR